MESFDNLFKPANMAQTVLVVLFILFLSMPQPLPTEMARMIDTPLGTILVIGVALSLFMYSNPVLAIFGLFVAFELLRRSGMNSFNFYMPTDSKKWDVVKEANKVDYTLEQEVIKNMAPLVNGNVMNRDYSFNPISDYTHDAENLF